MKTRSRLFSVLIGVIGMMAIFSHTALAQDDIPGSCQADARSQNAYRLGEQFSIKTVDQLWNTYNKNCGQLESFYTIVEDVYYRLVLPPNASLSVQCRHAGLVNGAIGALDDLWLTCGAECKGDGEAIGRLIGALYCDLSISLGGLEPADDFVRGDVMYCQALGELFCDITYMSFTPTYKNEAGQECRPYTVEPYYVTWDQFRNNGCAENPNFPIHSAQEDDENMKDR